MRIVLKNNAVGNHTLHLRILKRKATHCNKKHHLGVSGTEKTLPQSEGDGGSLSSRSSADDIVPVEGVRGSRRLKSPSRQEKFSGSR